MPPLTERNHSDNPFPQQFPRLLSLITIIAGPITFHHTPQRWDVQFWFIRFKNAPMTPEEDRNGCFSATPNSNKGEEPVFQRRVRVPLLRFLLRLGFLRRNQ